ncbi:FHA domain-containing protein [Opitutus sp. GAS368]|uniref:FHA domain-containing protein n=1 Tax=Opitutus sp. GAS368 TaxID=1882749 RepID=UPI00087B8E7E|nr:FHA domain-containing protein [Opitutus sp. GAS368]SDR88718.1 FHA domain-containing protein [Opitutus sp. GAS368]
MDAPLPQAWLEFADGRMHWLDKNACTIGRIASNTLALDQPGLSRSHAMIQPTPGGGWLLTDLRSTNGTYHNGLRLEQGVALHDGDKIELGDTTLTFRCRQTADHTTEAGATSVQIHSGDCWLLMLDLIGHTAHTHAVGAEQASADFKRWLEFVRPGLVRSGGTINAYLGDALFAYWRQDRHPAEKVAAAVQELVALQTTSHRPFRIILHHGRIRISGGLQGESLAGTDVIFLFRMEKSTKPLGATCVLSETAAKTLALTATARPLGAHPVPSFPGDHAFYALGG